MKAHYKKGKSGYYSTFVWDGTFNPDGTKHRVHLRSKISSEDLERQVFELRHHVETGTAVRRSEATIAEYAAQWMETKAVYTRNTQRQYAEILKYYIIPEIGNVRISELSKAHFQHLISINAAHPRTCQLIRRTVLQLAESAVEDRILMEAALRPLRSVALPQYRAPERRVLTDMEKAAIFSANLTDMQKCFVYLLYFCGLRRGEALGMTSDDVDLSRSTLRVCRAVEFIHNSSAIKPPKSQKGYRTIPLAPPFVHFLAQYIPTRPGYLIHNKNGGIMTQSGFRRMWEIILREFNRAVGGTPDHPVITGLTPHIFRHNLCTELCYQIPALSTKKIASIMGHDEAMVISIYSHILEDREDAQGAFSRIFAGSVPNVFQSLPANGSTTPISGESRPCFGSRMPQVRILSSRYE